MSHISILKRSIRTTAAALFFVGLLSPANATDQHDAVSVLPDLPITATADHAGVKAVARSKSVELTSRRPWLAPVGHRQPRQADVPSEAVSAWERQQQQLDQELDRKLIICRGC
ncbi:hypothetical protein [Bradyrhizobium sp. AUGA SZCCT0431]|uniref:hypothetical protein n=1 Tax=Bradyrhizobium sp. AUGA SZCCT0431 TaxID=2807674 RepID=UPI001BADF24A|nr:hypothetical protein [Bradyrhizobium sp. AUGA SZCCT0431]MBR1147521.1 hypothetical protein [Bradyrhizobium sp. AUGA SZCCT0431]